MSQAAAIEAAHGLRALAVEHSLGPLETVRVDAEVGRQAHAAATQVLALPHPAELWGAVEAGSWVPDLLDLAGRLLWSRQFPATRAVLTVLSAIGPTLDPREPAADGESGAVPPWRALLAGYLALADLTETGPDQPTTTVPALDRAARDLWGAADHYLAVGDRRRAALVASAGLWVLFHQELHDARPTSPLVSDPDGWLAPLRQGRVGRLLTQATASGDTPPGAASPRSRLVVLSGVYPRFAAPVIEALQADADLEVNALALSKVAPPFRRMAVEPWLVELRMLAALGQPVSYPAVQEALAGAGSVLADWGDAGAMLASLTKPPGAALSVRVHSVDALRCWLHLVDWSAVDQLICVGPHVQDLVDAQLGERVAHVRHTVLPNLVHLGRFDHPRAAGTDHTLAMVGWGRAVKDPLWTVELLARLREHDPRWRLLLVGHPFPDVLPPTGRDYARRFAARVEAEDVRDAIEQVGYTEDLAPVLARAGWVVSSSVRESWGVGPMEAVAAGAVPVIRNWPLFARWGGPRRLYPADWVVDSLDEAERHILRITAEGRRAEVAAASRELLSGLFDPAETAAGYRSALTENGPGREGAAV